MPRASIIQQIAPLPDDLSMRHGLFALYAIQQWESMPTRQEPYAPGYFYNNVQGMLNGLTNVSRQTVLRHLFGAVCVACSAEVDPTRTTFDHLMPLADGGPDDPSNSIVLCRPCNSSKGKKDLLEWWQWKGYKALDLPRTILVLYARIYWQHTPAVRLDGSIPPAMQMFLLERLTCLPSEGHRIALVGATFAGVGMARWLGKDPGRA